MTPIAPWALERIAAPKVEPVTLEEVKAYVKIDNSEEDALLAGLIVSAREMAERYLRLSLATQIFQLTIQGCVEADVHVPQGPVQSVSSVETIARNGAIATVDPATYELHVNRQVLVFDVVPQAHRLRITYVSGFSGSGLPRPIKYGLLAHIAALYDRRGDAETPMPKEALALYASYREVRL